MVMNWNKWIIHALCSFSAVLPFNEEFETIWEAHMQLLIPCSKCSRKFFPDRIEVHMRSCKGPIGGVKPAPQQQQQQPKPPEQLQAVTANTLSSPAIMANVEMLLSTPLTIRRQLHSQTDAVEIKKKSSALPVQDDVEKSQSD